MDPTYTYQVQSSWLLKSLPLSAIDFSLQLHAANYITGHIDGYETRSQTFSRLHAHVGMSQSNVEMLSSGRACSHRGISASSYYYKCVPNKRKESLYKQLHIPLNDPEQSICSHWKMETRQEAVWIVPS